MKIWDWLNVSNTHLERFCWLGVTVRGLRWETIIEQHTQLFHALISREPEEADFLTAIHLHMMLKEQESIIERYPDYFKKSQDKRL